MRGKVINILLVEDDEVDVLNVKRSFSRGKISNPLYVAGNGLEALKMLKGENGNAAIDYPRVILLDLNMPKMNGFEFLEQIRNDPQLRTSTVYVMTTSDNEKDIFEAYKHLIAGYIVKPVDCEKFMGAVNTLNACWELCDFPDKPVGPQTSCSESE